MFEMIQIKKAELEERGYKGFTLMEMLIVVAIIAVLVAIAIPVFSGQLEKSREAADMANIRSAYAEVMASALTQDTANGVTKDGSEGSFVYTKKVTLTQSQEGWQNNEKTIAGVEMKGSPTASGEAVITYTQATDACTITLS